MIITSYDEHKIWSNFENERFSGWYFIHLKMYIMVLEYVSYIQIEKKLEFLTDKSKVHKLEKQTVDGLSSS